MSEAERGSGKKQGMGEPTAPAPTSDGAVGLQTDNDAKAQSGGMMLGWEFVAMLFALTVAKIAENTAPLIQAAWSINWVEASRIALVGFVVASSWIGWSVSQKDLDRVQRVFSLPFVILLVDLILVVLYFKMAEGIGRGVASGPGVVPEALWTTIIFGFYLVWDGLTAKSSHAGSKGGKSSGSKTSLVNLLMVRWLITAVCLAIALTALLVTLSLQPSYKTTAVVNLTLLGIFIVFRAGKQYGAVQRLRLAARD